MANAPQQPAESTIRWGILGTGGIAKKFTATLQSLPGAQVVAVGSRTQAAADEFGDKFSVAHRHATYQALADDPDVDVVYVATVHPLHKDNMLACLNAGKAVLCEKPFTLNAQEAQAAIDLARQKRVFLMEAMWNRFIPLTAKVRELLAEGVLGEVQMLVANYCFRYKFNPVDRLYAPELGGGALLDAGVYPVSFASLVFGTPKRVASLAHLGETGVDEAAGAVFDYGQGRLAMIYMGVKNLSPREATIMGTLGQLKLHGPWWNPNRLTLTLNGQPEEVIDVPYEGSIFRYEALEVMDCMRRGQLESRFLPLHETASIMDTMDQMRAQWGLRYPTE